jgi:hypothetical protein
VALKVILVVVLFFSSYSRAENSILVGPTLGGTSSNSSSGSGSNTPFTYGLEATFLHDKWMGGFSYAQNNQAVDGTAAVSVGQSNQWLEAQFKYKIIDDVVSPFVFIGVGEVFQTVNTQILGMTESNYGSFFVKDIGVGFITRFSPYLGLSVSGKYYQFSNTNGFYYGLSFGYFPIL